MRPELRSLIPVVLCVLFPVSSAMSASGLPGDFNDDGLVNAPPARLTQSTTRCGERTTAARPVIPTRR